MTVLERSVSVLVLAVLLNLAFSTFSPQISQFLPFYHSTSSNSNSTMSSNLVLYGFPMSTCTCRVAVVLKEKGLHVDWQHCLNICSRCSTCTGIPFELKNVDLFTGEHKSPEFMAKQPFGQVPVLVVRDA